MKEFIKKNAKMYMILSICILIGTIGVTYAYYSAAVTNNTDVVGTAGGGELPTLTVTRITTEADGNLIPVDMDTDTLTKAASRSPKCIDNNGYTGCQIYSVTVKNNSNIEQSYNIELSRVSGANTPNVDAVTMGTSNSTVSNADSIKDNGLICTTNKVGNNETTTTCYFMVLIKNINSAQTDNGTFTGTVTVTSSAGAKVKANFGSGEKLTTTIENLYNNASKSTVTNNGITYNYATSVSLMNDRLGTSGKDINAGNIRYYGANPLNYVDIGDVYEQDTEKGNWEKYGLPVTSSSECYAFFSDESLINQDACTDTESCDAFRSQILQQLGLSSLSDLCDATIIPKGTPKSLYRIIGLFKDVELANGSRKDLIKVIRNETIGTYSWDTSDSTVNNGYGINEWSQADLMKLLNPGYEKEIVGGSLFWNSGSGSCYVDSNNETVDCDFTNNGLSKSVQNNIEVVKWNLGGWNTNTLYANDIYGYERGNNVIQNPSDGILRTTLWTGRVALAYPSDYGYAVDLSSCSSNLGNYSNCIGTNWMYNSMTANGNSSSWLLTPFSSFAESACLVPSSGFVNNGYVRSATWVSPVFYLDSELTVESGTGKSDDPYVLW